MNIKRVYMKEDIEHNIDNALDALDVLKANDEVSDIAYGKLFDIIALIAGMNQAKTYVVDVRPQ